MKHSPPTHAGEPPATPSIVSFSSVTPISASYGGDEEEEVEEEEVVVEEED